MRLQSQVGEAGPTLGSAEQVRGAIEAALGQLGEARSWPKSSPLSPRRIVGLLVPEEAPELSGAVATQGYAELIRDGRPRSILVVAADERATESRWLPAAMLATALGPVGVDRDVAAALDQAGLEQAPRVPPSLLWQVAYLQTAWPDLLAQGLVVPVVSSAAAVAGMAKVVGRALEGRDLVVVAATRLTQETSPARAQHKDYLLLAALLQLDLDGVYKVMQRQRVAEQGFGALLALLSLAKALGSRGGHYIKYSSVSLTTQDGSRAACGMAAVRLVR